MKIKLHLLFFSSMVLCCFFEIKSSNIKTVTLPEVSFTSPLVPTIFDLYVDSTLKTLEDPQNNYYIYISFKRYNKTNEPYPYVFISVAQKEFFYPIKIKGYTTYRDIFVFVSGNMSDCFTKEESNLKEFKYSKYRGLYEGCMEWWFQIVGDTIKLVNHIDWRKPWLGFNGLGWYDNRARVLDALTGRFTTPDPLAERYPDQSPYAHCAGNPVKNIDPDGREVIAADIHARRNIINTLSKAEAKYVRFDDDNRLDVTLINQYSGSSDNFTALHALANSKTRYIFAVAGQDINGSKYYEKGSNQNNPDNYSYGVTNMSGMEHDPSPNENVYIYTASFLDEKAQARNTAHEGYGHAYFFELRKNNPSINPNHTKGVVDTGVEYDPDLKANVTFFIFGQTNTALENQIKKVEKQAIKNYEDRSP